MAYYIHWYRLFLTTEWIIATCTCLQQMVWPHKNKRPHPTLTLHLLLANQFTASMYGMLSLLNLFSVKSLHLVLIYWSVSPRDLRGQGKLYKMTINMSPLSGACAWKASCLRHSMSWRSHFKLKQLLSLVRPCSIHTYTCHCTCNFMEFWLIQAKASAHSVYLFKG